MSTQGVRMLGRTGIKLTQAQRHAIACRLDPAVFSIAAGITPDPWQARVLLSNAQRILLNCSRQSGKSTTAGTLALHTALYDDASLTVMLSPSLRQSGELFRKTLAVYRTLRPRIPIDPQAETALTLELENGSRIVSLPGKEGTIRGFSSVKLLIADEASRIPDELMASVRPMLAVSHGREVDMSTPFGGRGWWYLAWRDGGDLYERYEVPATECPRITPEFLAEEKRTIGDWWYQQEYCCAFLDAQSTAFRQVDIEAALDPEMESWDL